MQLDDIIYISLLFGSIGFGYVYRTLDNDRVARKRWIGSAAGLFIILVVSGVHIFHIFLSFAIGTLILLVFDVRQAHLLCFGFMFSYLLFFRTTSYFGIPNPPGHTNLVQMILTLKLVGLAFERNTAAVNLKEESEKTLANKEEQTISDIKRAYYEDVLDLNVEDVFHYCFNFIGVLTGPYYSYRTFRDYFTAKYFRYVNCDAVALDRLKWVIIYASFFLSVSYTWPISYVINDEFYYERSFLYRLWYVWPSFFIFRMRIYIGLTLSEGVCIMSGLGAYPKEFKSTPGGGPRQIVALDQPVDEATMDFETIHNVDAETTEKCITFREAMRSYNMCVQYWMAIVVYKRFPNKKLRTMATLLVSAFWHGVYPGYYMCMLGAPLYLPIESLYDKLFRQRAQGLQRTIIDIIFWISKFFAFSYMGIAFLLMTMDKIWHYYKSVYHFGYILWILMYLFGLLLQVQMKSKAKDRERRPQREADSSPSQVTATEYDSAPDSSQSTTTAYRRTPYSEAGSASNPPATVPAAPIPAPRTIPGESVPKKPDHVEKVYTSPNIPVLPAAPPASAPTTTATQAATSTPKTSEAGANAGHFPEELLKGLRSPSFSPIVRTVPAPTAAEQAQTKTTVEKKVEK